MKCCVQGGSRGKAMTYCMHSLRLEDTAACKKESLSQYGSTNHTGSLTFVYAGVHAFPVPTVPLHMAWLLRSVTPGPAARWTDGPTHVLWCTHTQWICDLAWERLQTPA
eukprot:29528-Chlamydomonas_euryale.AAC.3